MYRTYDITQGEAVRLYRTPEEIRRDMCEISEKIKSTSVMLNVRNMLMEILALSVKKPVHAFIGELEDMISGARASLAELSAMEKSLTELQCELEDAKWAAGI